MNEVKNSIKRLALYYLLLTVYILINCDIIPSNFPLENISFLYLITLSICLFMRYRMRVVHNSRLKTMMLSLTVMISVLIMLQGVKYSVFNNTFVLARYTWYLHYVPFLLIPTFFFYISLYVYTKDRYQVKKIWGWIGIISIVFIALVLTNDIHLRVFMFNDDFSDWDSKFSFGWLFFAAEIWEYLLYTAGVLILIIKSRLKINSRKALVILIPYLIGVIMIVLKIMGKMPAVNGISIIEYPEIICFMVVGILECCIQVGLIPTNENYMGLMKISSVSTQITDLNGNVIYKSGSAKRLSEEDFLAPDNTRIEEHTILRRMDLPGGYGFWQNDVTELDRLNEELEEAREALSEEAELTRLKNELKEKQTKIEQRSLVYDKIAGRTQSQSMEISNLADLALASSDLKMKDMYRNRITMLGAYIKRYANMMLLSSETGTVSIGELGISIREILRYLNLCGVAAESVNTAEGTIDSETGLAVFEAFEKIIEDNLSEMTGVYANLTEIDRGFALKLNIENITVGVSEATVKKLNSFGVEASAVYEDGIGYISFFLSEGGERK